MVHVSMCKYVGDKYVWCTYVCSSMYGACIYAQVCMCKYVCAHNYLWQKSYNSMVHVVRNARFITNPYELTGHRGIVTGGKSKQVGSGEAPGNVCNKPCLHIYGPRICAMCILCFPQVCYTHVASYHMRSVRRGAPEPSATGLDSAY